MDNTVLRKKELSGPKCQVSRLRNSIVDYTQFDSLKLEIEEESWGHQECLLN